MIDIFNIKIMFTSDKSFVGKFKHDTENFENPYVAIQNSVKIKISLQL
jgi:hypothetical protein